ncbi:bifunctional folylpolyglutamate synthase/dihydrofolate synthase [Anaerosalibacter sp. Marseille-P3206]|uniref:bifunctional folylpolyglutamate synthase/dihydrofolate synthase n=1 Tax=Anaerosalibacter sp. Marseille-P3206 TaxID=1871005 RepID=UPI000985CF63|nr:folylpolyglutamate synthase/dihydrofolate synthase family protein [Anaerosalibacter sp. Marseille-P3206]
MNYNEALDFINSAEGLGSRLGLVTIGELMNRLGNPQKDLRFIHVGGTNGKGSTTSFIVHMLREAGYRVGVFTSPYLERFNERIQVNGEDISNEDFAKLTEKVKIKTEEMVKDGYPHPTVFELITATMFLYFKEAKVDIAVLEVGLGGRIDSTNIIDDSLISVITTIDYDHMEILGDTLYKIGKEKAGIIKKDGLVVSYPQQKEALMALEEEAIEKKAKLIVCPTQNIEIKELNDRGAVYDFKYNNMEFTNIKINLLGEHQVYNSSLALVTILELRSKGILDISDEQIIEGLLKTEWRGRLEILDREPIFLIDGAHNLQGINALAKSLKLLNYKRLILGIGILKDKDVDSMIKAISSLADVVVVTEVDSPRKMDANELADKIRMYNENIIIKKNVNEAIEKTLEIADKDDLVVFSGSIYLIGDVRKLFLSNK